MVGIYPINQYLSPESIILLIIQIEINNNKVEGVSGKDMKNIKNMLILSLVIKYGAFIVCTFLLFHHVLVGIVWFNPLTSIADTQNALNRGDNPDVYNSEGMNGIIFTVWSNSPNDRVKAELLLDAGADVEAPVFGCYFNSS